MGTISVERVTDKALDLAPFAIGAYIIYLIIKAHNDKGGKK